MEPVIPNHTRVRAQPRGGKSMSEIIADNRHNSYSIPSRNIIFFDNIPDELKALPRWVMWRLEPGKDGNVTKIPYDARRGTKASCDNPDTWTDFDFCRKLFEMGHYSGIGFELSQDDDILCIDLDDKSGTNKLSEYIELSKQFNSWTEISYSGKGVHIWCKGKKPGNSCRRGDLEIYERDRFIAITGNQVEGSPDELNCAQHQIDEFYSGIESSGIPTRDKAPCSGYSEFSDAEVLEYAKKYSYGFDSLWRGDFSKYPSRSEADAALTCILAWYSKDFHQIDRLFRQSGLYREKWDRTDYKIKTIEYALRKVPGQFDPNYRKPIPHKTALISDQKPGSWNLTDIGNAERFVHWHGKNVKYCPTLKDWFIWNGCAWIKDEINERDILAIDTVRRIYGEAEKEADEAQRTKLAKWATKSEDQNRRNNMLQTASSMLAIHHSLLDAKPDLFNLLNGTYNLKTHEFREHRQEDLLTKLAGVAYQPGATCPTWNNHLKLIFDNDEHLINSFQELCGYSLLSGNPAEIFIVAWGSGRNGKGKTFDAITHVMGDYAGNTPFSTFTVSKRGGGRGEASPEIVDMMGKRFIRASESEEGARLSEALIKQVTGGDLITARGLYKGFVTFKPEFVIFLQTNHKPVIRNWDQAIEARLWLIPFNTFILPEKRDYHILDKLIAEGPGIFNWMLEGLKRYQKYGFLEMPEVVKKATEEYRKEQDTLGEFVSSLCVKDGWCYRKHLYDAYYNDCLKNGVEPVSQNLFSKLLQSHHGVREGPRRNDGRTWKGIRLKSDGDTSDTFSENSSDSDDENKSQNKTSDVSPGQEEEPLRVDRPQFEEIGSDTCVTCDTLPRISVREGGISKSHGGSDISVTSVTSLDGWLARYGFPSNFPVNEYEIIPKEERSKYQKCVCGDCKGDPLHYVRGLYHPICTPHYRELWDLLKNEKEQEHQQ